MLYKWLDGNIYEEFISFIQKDFEKTFGYQSSYIEDYIDDLPENHPDKVYYTCSCFYGYNSERDVFPIYASELNVYFEDFKGLYRQLQIDKLFKE
jgi:hypothetical protein